MGVLTILRVYELEVARVAQRLVPGAVEPEDPVELVRPGDDVSPDVPLPASEVGDGLRFAELRGRQRKSPARPLPLGQCRGEDQQADRRDRERGLGELHALGCRHSSQRNRAVDGSPRADGADQEGARRGSDLLEAKRSPEEQRKDQVRVAPGSSVEDDRAHARDRCQERPALEEPGARWPAVLGGVVEDEDDRCDYEDSHGVSEPPEQPGRAVGAHALVGEREDRDAVRRADHGADERASHHQREDRPDAVERRREADPRHEQRARHRRQRVAHGDSRRHCEGGLGRGVRGESADRHGRPVAHAQDQERGESDPRRRPDRGDHALGHRQAQAELGGAVVGARDQHEPGGRPQRPPLQLQRPVVESPLHHLRGPVPRGELSQTIRSLPSANRRRPASEGARSPRALGRSRPPAARSPRAARGGRRRRRRGRSGRGPRG